MFPSRTAPTSALLALGLAALLPGLALAQVTPQPVQVKPAAATAKPAGVTVKPAGATAAPAAGGSAQIENVTFEAGDVHKGEVINHDFVVKNTGKTDLLILDVKPACGCTTPGFDKIVPAGGTGKITLKVDTSTFKGPISKTANVTTNDPQNSNIRLAINANVTTYVEVLPRDSVFFRQSIGEEKREELTIKSNEPGEFKIKEVQVSGANVKHELAPVAGKTGEYKLALWMDPSTPVGNFSGSVKVLTNSPKEPEVRITVNGSILGQLSVNPSTLFFRVDSGAKEVVAKAGALELRERGEVAAPVVEKLAKDARVKVLEEVGDWMRVGAPSGVAGWVASKSVTAAPASGDPQVKVVNITHRESKPFKITGTSIDGKDLPPTSLKVTTAPAADGSGQQVTITYGGGLATGNFSGSLVVKTDAKDESEVRIPVYIVIT